MAYHVYVADLNSLYDEKPRPPVMVGEFATRNEALVLVRELQAFDTAAWIEEDIKCES